jgi:hypothetical protein
MKNSCRTIEPFLYLYRKGELTTEDRRMVDDHAAQCAACRNILADLQLLDSAIAQVRNETPELVRGRSVVPDVLAELNRRSGPSISFLSFLPVDVPRWTRPVLSFTLLALAILFLVQEYRDAAQVCKLEERLRERGAAAGSTRADLTIDPNILKGLIGTGNKAAVDPLQLLSATIPHFLGQRQGLFDELAKRYPGLSQVTIADGLDEHEKAVLAIEGKALLKEVEQLVREGAK